VDAEKSSKSSVSSVITVDTRLHEHQYKSRTIETGNMVVS
jgi:hypothetical protein